MYFYLVDNVKKCFVTFLGKSLFKSHFSKTTLAQITEEVACHCDCYTFTKQLNVLNEEQTWVTEDMPANMTMQILL